MRPTDEDQHGSTRPNLLSGARHRFGSDDNILERLERDSARQASGNRSRAARYAAAASLVLLVIVFVAWMAYENARDVHVVPMTRASSDGSSTVTGMAPDSPPAPSAAASAQSAPATIVEDDLHHTLTPPETTAQRPAAPQTTPALARPSASLPAATAAPRRDSASAHLPPLVLLSETDVVPRKPALLRKPPAPTPVVAVARGKPAASASPAPPQPAPIVRAATRPAVAARPRQPAGKSVSSDAVVDRDVALLSAIIIHDSAHAEEKAQLEAASACSRATEKKCGRR